jgi:hypothetical protein
MATPSTKLIGRDERGQPRRIGGVVERHPDTEHEGDDREFGHRRVLAQGDDRRERHAQGLEQGVGEQDRLLPHAIGDHAAEQGRDDDAQGARGGDDGELTGSTTDPDDLPDDGHGPDTARKGRQHERDGQPPIGTQAQRCQGTTDRRTGS